jgi:hypothetical protein
VDASFGVCTIMIVCVSTALRSEAVGAKFRRAGERAAGEVLERARRLGVRAAPPGKREKEGEVA